MKNILIPIVNFSATLLKSILCITETAALEHLNIILVYIKPILEDNRENNNKTDKAILKLCADYMDLRSKSKINISVHIAFDSYSEIVKAYRKKKLQYCSLQFRRVGTSFPFKSVYRN